MDPALSDTYEHDVASSSSYPLSSQTSNGVLVLWGSIDPTIVDEDALNDWWTNEHLPERVCLPGFKRARRYCALEPEHGRTEYLALYETSNVQDLASAEYLYALNYPTKRTLHFMPYLAKMSRFACETIWSTSSPVPTSDQATTTNKSLLMLVFEVNNATDNPARLVDDYLSRKGRGVLADTTCSQIAKVNQDITRTGSASKSYDNVRFDSPSGGDGTKTADTFVALLEFGSTADGSASELSSSSELLRLLTTTMETAGLHIQYINTYTLVASLARSQIAC
jgi:hypothetical protein